MKFCFCARPGEDFLDGNEVAYGFSLSDALQKELAAGQLDVLSDQVAGG